MAMFVAASPTSASAQARWKMATEYPESNISGVGPDALQDSSLGKVPRRTRLAYSAIRYAAARKLVPYPKSPPASA
jgi:hypothetical protein